jgi:hypothetical protein
MFMKLGQVFIYIVAFVGKGLAIHMDWLNIEGSDLKPYFIRFWTHNVQICTWQQSNCYHYNKLEEITGYVPIRDSHQNVEFCYDRKITPKVSSNAKLVVSKL